ncbi:MAG: acyl-CoA dehydrogenase family protein [Acidimicrobiia bacterium]|nr:acyl-CoA dehydrogenase family protein [Acidimicrobiia bacterium]
MNQPAERSTDEELLALAHAIADPDHPVKRDMATWAAGSLAGHDRLDADASSAFAVDDWRRCADHGVFRLMVPRELGGAGCGIADVLLALEGLGKGCRDNGLTFAVGSQVLSTQDALVEFGSAEQQRRWLQPMMDGSAIGAFAMTEPETGSDAYNISTTAERRPDGSYVVNGHKAYITFGSVCDMVVTFASTDPSAGQWGLSAFLVPCDLDGVERLGNREKMGMRTTPFGDIGFTDVVVPESALLGREGAGASIFNAVLQVERAFVFATQIGALDRQLDEAIRYAQEREQGGRRIGEYQAIAHRLVDMKQRHETARLFLYRAAIAMVSGRDFTLSAALAKLVGSETGVSVALDAGTIHGAKGYVTEFEVERNLRDAVGGLVYSGTSDIQRNIIARLLGVG